jgi:hypothetical protein
MIDGIDGSGLIVTVVETVAEHPLGLITVYEIIVFPAATPVITPVPELTVAIAVFDELHTPPVVELDSVVVDATQTEVIPVIGATTGNALIVTVAVTELVQPFAFVYVYVIVLVPAVTPVTTPVIEFTVATAALLLVHTPPAVVLVNVDIEPSHNVVVPAIADKTGRPFTITYA